MTRVDDEVVTESAAAPRPPTGHRPRRGVGRVWRLVGDLATATAVAVVSVATAWWVLGLTRAEVSQRWLNGGPDGLLHYGLFKSALEQVPFLRNEHLGFPQGQNLFFAPILDPVTVLEIRVFGLLSSDVDVVLSLYELAGFALVALTGYWFLRLLGLRWYLAAVLAWSFSVFPWHFMQLQGHGIFANYWAVPLIGVLGLVVGGRATDPFVTWPRGWRTAAPLAVAVAVGLTVSYFSAFAALLLGTVFFLRVVAVLVKGRPALARSAWADLRVPFLSLVALAVTVGTQLLAFSLDRGGEVIVRYYTEGRWWGESELYAGKLSTLLLPWNGTGFPWLRHVRETYDALTLVVAGEGPWGSLVASVGTVMALLVVGVRLASAYGGSTERGPADGGVWRARLDLVALLTLVALLFYVTTGLGVFFAAVVSPEVRAWSRLAIVIALFATAVVGLLVQRLVSSRWRLLGIGVVAALVPLVLVDQVTGARSVATITTTDDGAVVDYAAAVDDALPEECGVVQLPLHGFPERGPVEAMGDYDHLLPYLRSTDLRWSYGAVQGTVSGEFWNTKQEYPAAELLAVAAGVDACAMSVDRNGYAAGSTFESDLRAAIGAPPAVESSDGRWALYVLE